jgi:hypothetical protein
LTNLQALLTALCLRMDVVNGCYMAAFICHHFVLFFSSVWTDMQVTDLEARPQCAGSEPMLVARCPTVSSERLRSQIVDPARYCSVPRWGRVE